MNLENIEKKESDHIMANRHGSLSINSENIFPIIKKWLYSDHDIFFREMISNGCDATVSYTHLAQACRHAAAAELPMLEPCRKAIRDGVKPTIEEIRQWRKGMDQKRKEMEQ